ncbi:MAG: DNA alkylation repair protein [Patescibacteria group bacterium]|jgi:3-methyladenine DNA glycosylase AlkD
MKKEDIITKIKSLKNEKNIAGMARFGINTKNTYGVSMPILRQMAKEIKKSTTNNHELAMELWNSEIHEARMIAAFIEDPKNVTENQMDEWVNSFNSWDICDSVCGSLFDKTPFAYKKIKEYILSEKEYTRRAGFVMVAWLAVHNKKAEDKVYTSFFPLIEKYSTDERNFVKKAVNWALRQIGKRNKKLNIEAIELAKKIQPKENKAAKWIAANALNELKNKKF